MLSSDVVSWGLVSDCLWKVGGAHCPVMWCPGVLYQTVCGGRVEHVVQ